MNFVRNLVVRVVRAVRVVTFLTKSGGRATIGTDFVIGPRCRVARGRRIIIGDRVNIAADFVAQSNIDIGDDVMISAGVAFIGDDHSFSDPNRTIQQQELLPPSQAIVEGDNLIGFGVLVLGNVTIGHGAIIGAGSLVTSDLPPDWICYGRPAKPMRRRR